MMLDAAHPDIIGDNKHVPSRPVRQVNPTESNTQPRRWNERCRRVAPRSTAALDFDLAPVQCRHHTLELSFVPAPEIVV